MPVDWLGRYNRRCSEQLGILQSGQQQRIVMRRRVQLQAPITRLQKNKVTQLYILLQRCTQISKDDRLILRQKIKRKDQDVVDILQHYKKESDLPFVQLELRRLMQASKREQPRNHSNFGHQNSRRNPVQIRVQVVPVRGRKAEQELRENFQREMNKEMRLIEVLERGYSKYQLQGNPEPSVVSTNLNEQGEIQSPRKTSSQTSCARNSRVVDPMDADLSKDQLGILRQQTLSWYDCFNVKYRDSNFREQVGGGSPCGEDCVSDKSEQFQQKQWGSHFPTVSTTELYGTISEVSERFPTDQEQLFSFRRRGDKPECGGAKQQYGYFYRRLQQELQLGEAL